MSTHTDEQLLSAQELAWPGDGDVLSLCSEFISRCASTPQYGWGYCVQQQQSPEHRDNAINIAVFLLALGILPDGWERIERGEEFDHIIYRRGWKNGEARVGDVAMEVIPAAGHIDVTFPQEAPEAVRTGQAQIACLLLAAHVELERRRGGEL